MRLFAGNLWELRPEPKQLCKYNSVKSNVIPKYKKKHVKFPLSADWLTALSYSSTKMTSDIGTAHPIQGISKLNKFPN